MMKPLRGVIVGASTLLGKELAEELNAADWDVHLADAGDVDGQIVSAGDEALVIQPLRPDVFDGMDVAFFADDPATTRTHWQEAHRAGASVVDLSGGLEAQPTVLVRCPWVPGGKAPDLTTVAVVPAHPAAIMLAIVASRLGSKFGDVRLAATVLEPASQQGSRGLDEMHQQTVGLLGFQSVPKDVYDAQVAFNLRVNLGGAAKLDLAEISDRIRRHIGAIGGDEAASRIAMQLVQAPVFHGYTMSVFVELPEGADVAAVQDALKGGVVEVAGSADEAPSNETAMESAGIRIAVADEEAHRAGSTAFWLWIAADNLKLAAHHAASCAAELALLRPAEKIQ